MPPAPKNTRAELLAIGRIYAADGIDAVMVRFDLTLDAARWAVRRARAAGIKVPTPHGASNSRRGIPDWRTDDLRELAARWMQGDDVAALAQHFGRTVNAIRVRVRALKLPLREQPCWTPGQRRVIDAEVDALVHRLMLRFGRSRGAIVNRLTRSAMESPKRQKVAQIVDLGGMRDTNVAHERNVSLRKGAA